MYDLWKVIPFKSKVIVVSVFVFVALFIFALSLQWIAGNFLYALAWKYSAIITVPLGIYAAVSVYKSTELRQKLGRQFWFAVLLFALLPYYMAGFFVMKMPGAVVYFLPFQRSTESITVVRLGSNPQQCLGKSTIDMNKYPSFLQSSLCIKGDVAGSLKPGDKLAIEGKSGLGGMLVEKYVKVR